MNVTMYCQICGRERHDQYTAAPSPYCACGGSWWMNSRTPDLAMKAENAALRARLARYEELELGDSVTKTSAPVSTSVDRWLSCSHEPDCATNKAHEAGHYEGEFGTTRHWVYDTTVKCDCPVQRLLDLLATLEADLDGAAVCDFRPENHNGSETPCVGSAHSEDIEEGGSVTVCWGHMRESRDHFMAASAQSKSALDTLEADLAIERERVRQYDERYNAQAARLAEVEAERETAQAEVAEAYEQVARYSSLEKAVREGIEFWHPFGVSIGEARRARDDAARQAIVTALSALDGLEGEVK